MIFHVNSLLVDELYAISRSIISLKFKSVQCNLSCQIDVLRVKIKVTLCMLDKFVFLSSLSCTIYYQDYLRNITCQTVWSCLIWVQTAASPQSFCVTFRINLSVKTVCKGNKLQQAKLNLFADKRLCHCDSSKCLSEGHNV